MGERLLGQLVVARAGDRRDLQRGLERLPLPVQPRVVAAGRGRAPPGGAVAAAPAARPARPRSPAPGAPPSRCRPSWSSRRAGGRTRRAGPPAGSGPPAAPCAAARPPGPRRCPGRARAASSGWRTRTAARGGPPGRAPRCRPLRLAQLAGVLAVRGDRDERLRGEALVALERLERRRLPGRVAVEGVDDLAEVERVVADQPADHRDVVGAERRAAGGDRGRHAGQVHGHHVGVALDDDDLAALGDLPLGQVEPEQHLRLVVDGGVGGVEVLGLDAVVVEQPAGAEADHVAAEVADRPEQPAVEPVDRAAPALLGQPGLDQLLDARTRRRAGAWSACPSRPGRSRSRRWSPRPRRSRGW